MSDLISRQDAIDLVEHRMKHNPMKSFQFIQGLQDAYLRVISDLNRMPTADVVEVVRCKDCKHWSKEFEACYIHDFCEIFQSDYYCASGERKEDGETLEHNKESRHGQWIISEPIYMHSICSCCGYYNAYNPYYKYCPDCGADMRGDAE